MFSSARWFAGTRNPGRTWSLSVASSSPATFALLGLVLLAGVVAYALTHSVLSIAVVLAIVFAAFAWHIGPTASIGVFLLLMPLQYLAIALLQFAGVSQYQEISAIKEVILICGTLWLLYSTRPRLTAPDAILALALILAFCGQLFDWNPRGLRDDWEWAILYVLGRALLLNPDLQRLWAKCAVWMCAVLSVVGIWEVAYLGPSPRLLLIRVTSGEAHLPSAYLATGYEGFRAASTMDSPLAFSGLCAVALVLWWVYMKNPIPAIMIGAGLAFTLTRSATIATVIGIIVVAVRRRESSRTLIYGSVALLGFLIAIPTLNLTRYLNATVTAGADTSTLGHQQSIVTGFNMVLDHPIGTGAGTVGPRTLRYSTNALNIESSFLTIALEYGIVGGLLYAAFVALCLWQLFKLREPLGYAAFSVFLGYILLLAVGPLYLNIPLACWVWVPVGMGITRIENMHHASSSGLEERRAAGV